MTRDLDVAQREVKTALKRAEWQREKGSRLARGWAQARRDDNFRAMVRNLVRPSGEATSG